MVRENRFPSDFLYQHSVNCSFLWEAERLPGRRVKCDEQQIRRGDHNWHEAPSEAVEPKNHAGVLLYPAPRAASLTIFSPSSSILGAVFPGDGWSIPMIDADFLHFTLKLVQI